MTKRIVLAAILGGLAMFIWEFVAHDMLPLGEAGLKPLDSEPFSAAVKASVREPGFYMFPMGETAGMSGAQKQAAMQQYMDKSRVNPTGLMVVYPQGRDFNFGKNLATQFACDVAAMLLVSALVAWATMLKGLGARLLFVTSFGLIPTLVVQIPLWNWYGFPTAYMLAQATVNLGSFFAGGLVVAWLVRGRL